MKDTLGNLAIDLLQLEYCHDRLDVEVMALKVMGQQRDDEHQRNLDKLGRDIRAMRARLLRLAGGTPRGSIGQQMFPQ